MNATTRAISSTVAGRLSGTVEATSGIPSGPMTSVVPSVVVGPGETALTRIPSGAHSAAHVRVSATNAALVAPYAEPPGKATSAAIVVMLTMLPLPRAAILGASAAVRKNVPRTLTSNIVSKDATSWSGVGAKPN